MTSSCCSTPARSAIMLQRDSAMNGISPTSADDMAFAMNSELILCRLRICGVGFTKPLPRNDLRMGAQSRGFCTNILIIENGTCRQVRPRRPPNENTFIGDFGYNEGMMDQYWQPGHGVRFDRFREVASAFRRITHPEDVIFPYPMLFRENHWRPRTFLR